ncbi:MAG: hypothetical protein LV480_09245 [Methylacidiphilales bacterium]|nr:hypothetical protein [Candidatus Methylacidiphilales bacterium]
MEIFRAQLAREGLADAPVAADDGVAADGFDVFRFAMFFHGFSYFSFRDEPNE